MSDKFILDANGQPVPCDDLLAWGLWMEKASRRVACDAVGDVKVSTVFLGLNHNYWNGAPLLFETMVFGGPLDGEENRYATRDEALAGHAAMLARVKESA